jgi:hypothetical protein
MDGYIAPCNRQGIVPQKFQILDRERLYYRPYNENYTRGRIFR